MWVIVKNLTGHVNISSGHWAVTGLISRAGYLWQKHQFLLQLAIYIFSVIDIMVTDLLILFWLQYSLVRADIWGGQKLYFFSLKASKYWVKKRNKNKKTKFLIFLKKLCPLFWAQLPHGYRATMQRQFILYH